MSVGTPVQPNDRSTDEYAIALRARNADARRGRLVRGLMLTVSLLYVLVLLLAPLGGIVFSALKAGVGVIGQTFSQSDVVHAVYLTVVIMLITVVVTGVLGVVVALVLARDRFRGKPFVSAIVDLPLAVSPVIVGLMAVLLFGREGWFEAFLEARGIRIIYALPSMVLVTIFISIPFVIREVVPVLQELGASKLQTFVRVTLPNIRWGLLYGIALSAARAIGEIGAVLIVSGSLQGQTETATIYILRAFDQYQDQQGYIVALALAAFSIALLLGIEFLKHRRMREAR
jgi:sulfate/thiosulfate transport system permease protein